MDQNVNSPERERGRVLVSFIHDRHRIFFQLFYSVTFKLVFQNSFYNLIDCRVVMHSYYFCLNFPVDAFTFKFTSLSLQYLQQTYLQAMNFSLRSLQNASLWPGDVFCNAGSRVINLLCELCLRERETMIILIMYISSIYATYDKLEYNNFFFRVYVCVCVILMYGNLMHVDFRSICLIYFKTEVARWKLNIFINFSFQLILKIGLDFGCVEI